MSLSGSIAVWMLGASGTLGFQPQGKVPAPTVSVTTETPRALALRRDPHLLPHAAADRWKSFGDPPPRPEDIPNGMRTARAALLEQDLPAALTELYAVLDAEPDYPPALHQMGVLYFRLQRYSDAIEVFERFVQHVPSKVGETRTLGHCYYSLGDYARAKAHYERVLAAGPKEVEALRGLALSCMRLGDAPKALELLGQVVELEPKHADAWAWRAQILFDIGRSDEALTAATRARDLDPYEPRPWFLLGRILLDLGRDDEGAAAQSRYGELQSIGEELHSVEVGLEYGPHQLPLLMRMAQLRRATGDVARTRTALAHVLAERPADATLRIFALDLLEDMGDAEGARMAARSLEMSCPDDPAAWKRLEAYFTRQKDVPNQLRSGDRYRRLSKG